MKGAQRKGGRTKNPKGIWYVESKRGWRGKGADGKVYFRSNRSRLEELLLDIKDQVRAGGKHLLSSQQRSDAISALAVLPKGWTLLQCVESVRDRLARTTQPLTLAQAVRRFLDSKEHHREHTSFNLERRLNQWVATVDST